MSSIAPNDCKRNVKEFKCSSLLLHFILEGDINPRDALRAVVLLRPMNLERNKRFVGRIHVIQRKRGDTDAEVYETRSVVPL